jgi:hypothetical protein
MKLSLIITTSLAAALTMSAVAQTRQDNSAQLREERLAEILTQRETIIGRNLFMTPDERRDFWPLYRKYREERDAVDTRANRLTADLEQNFGNITTDLARKFTATMLELQRDDLAIKSKYRRSFEKALTPVKAAKFYQIENKLDAAVNFYRAERVPLMQ